jgi:hypothetical protein
METMQIHTVTQVDWNYRGDDKVHLPWGQAYPTMTEARAEIGIERHKREETNPLEWVEIVKGRWYAVDEEHSLEWVICRVNVWVTDNAEAT